MSYVHHYSLHLPHLPLNFYRQNCLTIFLSLLFFIADLYFAARDKFQPFPGRCKRCGTRIGLLPVYAGRWSHPPLLDRAYSTASAPRALIGGNLRFRRRIMIHDGDAHSLLLLLLRNSIWIKGERFSAVDYDFRQYSKIGSTFTRLFGVSMATTNASSGFAS